MHSTHGLPPFNLRSAVFPLFKQRKRVSEVTGAGDAPKADAFRRPAADRAVRSGCSHAASASCNRGIGGATLPDGWSPAPFRMSIEADDDGHGCERVGQQPLPSRRAPRTPHWRIGSNRGSH